MLNHYTASFQLRPASRSRALLSGLAVALGATFAPVGTHAQQDVQYTQFMYDKLTVNPAYAGAKGFPTAGVIARQQWAGFDGAPASQALRLHSPLGTSKLALGLRAQNDVIGPTRATGAGIAVAYHLPVSDRMFVSLGLDASGMQYRLDWADLRGADPEIDVPTDGAESRIIGNVGAGGMLYSDRFYLGVSAPRVLRNALSDSGGGREATHVYAMAGYDFRLGSDFKLRPAVNFKYVANAPADADVNATLVWRRLLGLGASYRTGGAFTRSRGESISGNIAVMPNDRLTVGAAYDYTLTEIGDYSSGSYELVLEYTLVTRTHRSHNPRYF